MHWQATMMHSFVCAFRSTVRVVFYEFSLQIYCALHLPSSTLLIIITAQQLLSYKLIQKFQCLQNFNIISYKMNKTFVLVALAALIAGAVYFTTESTKSSAFEQWKVKYGAKWERSENEYRRIIFDRNVEIINKHNADKSQTYKMGINKFTALTKEEYIQIYLDPKPQFTGIVDDLMTPINGDIDWTTQGGVSPIKDQGECGSCWAFSTTGVLESAAKLRGQTVILSEQQLLDCSGAYGNHGCNGGWPSPTLKYVQDNGLSLQKDYPYRGVTGTCQRNGGNFKIASQSSASGCSGIQNALQSKPVSVTLDATNWDNYESGVFSNCKTSINHAVLLVGIVDGNWKIKNSYGTLWGENGFIRLAPGNTCGICQYAGVTPNL